MVVNTQKTDAKPMGYTIETEMVPCTLAELEALLVESATDIETNMASLSELATTYGSRLKDDLRTIVDENILNKVTTFVSAEQIDCSFMGAAFNNFRYAMCFDIVGGIITQASVLAALGILGFFICMWLFGMWRYHIDNRTAWEEEEKQGTHAKDPDSPAKGEDVNWPEGDDNAPAQA
jgi:hypothetical protein